MPSVELFFPFSRRFLSTCTGTEAAPSAPPALTTLPPPYPDCLVERLHRSRIARSNPVCVECAAPASGGPPLLFGHVVSLHYRLEVHY
ncbi:hypothetical protein AVEN_17894-1 [Araneus ventricosus]|uniref:Uncharacterized protein n=1 Tax=Araneus ventricosus TaxID=182803 RepID=A0A4Y2I5G6_ARAVE|nr:hypothetical protein AVEN_17894-1 [Araneus ventricosus]